MYFCWLRLSLLHYSLCMDLTSTVCPFLLTSVFFNIFIPLAPPLQFSGNSTSCSSRFLFNHTLSPSTFPHCSLSSTHFYPSHLTQFSSQAPPLPTPPSSVIAFASLLAPSALTMKGMVPAARRCHSGRWTKHAGMPSSEEWRLY